MSSSGSESMIAAMDGGRQNRNGQDPGERGERMEGRGIVIHPGCRIRARPLSPAITPIRNSVWPSVSPTQTTSIAPLTHPPGRRAADMPELAIAPVCCLNGRFLLAESQRCLHFPNLVRFLEPSLMPSAAPYRALGSVFLVLLDIQHFYITRINSKQNAACVK